jgi:GNAT superfamily N-acetyltransferase
MTSLVATEDVSIRPMERTARDLELFRGCFARNSERPRSLESLRWQYFENTTDRLFVDLALAPGEDKLAAIYASLPGWMRIRGERRLALQSLDTLTDADFRGKGLFVKLATRTFQRATEDGAALIYGFPNKSSAPGFFKKLGWSPLDPVPFLFRPIRLGYFAERLKLAERARGLVPAFPLVSPFGRSRRRDVNDVAWPDARMTRLWERFAKKVGVAVERDAEYLRWRIFDKPGEKYRALVVENGSEIRALCIYCVKEKHGGRIGYLMELLFDPDFAGYRAASHLLGLAVREMADDGADSLLAWALPHSPTFPVLARHAFVPLPERFRPIELHAGVRAFDPSLADLVTRRSAWYLSYLDADTV